MQPPDHSSGPQFLASPNQSLSSNILLEALLPRLLQTSPMMLQAASSETRRRSCVDIAQRRIVLSVGRGVHHQSSRGLGCPDLYDDESLNRWETTRSSRLCYEAVVMPLDGWEDGFPCRWQTEKSTASAMRLFTCNPRARKGRGARV